MSGVETAGLVLATIPIFIKTVERFRSLAVLDRWSKTRHELRELELRAQVQSAVIENTVYTLLVDAGIPVAKLGDVDWKSIDNNKRLRAYLGETTYELVLSTLSDITNALVTAQRHLSNIQHQFATDKLDAVTERRLRATIKRALGPSPTSQIGKLRDAVDRSQHLQDILTNILQTRRQFSNLGIVAKAFADAADHPNTADEDDTVSVGSLETMEDDDKDELAFLPLIIWKARIGKFQKSMQKHCEALLDSGANKYCVSEEYCIRMNLTTENVPAETISLANEQKLFYSAEVKLSFSWKDAGVTEQIRRTFCVVKGLTADVVLPNSFISKRQHLLSQAKRRRMSGGHVAFLGFSWRPKKKREADRNFADSARAKNQAQEAEDRRRRENRLDALYGSIASTPTASVRVQSASTQQQNPSSSRRSSESGTPGPSHPTPSNTA